MRILIVEDEELIAMDLVHAISGAGYVVEREARGEAAWRKGRSEPFAAIILDLGLPDLDGLTILRRWRQEGVTTPVLILTARGAWADRVDGMDAGADDYLPKPFRMEEVLARLRALLRRSAGRGEPLIIVGPVTLDTRSRDVRVDGRSITLTPLEFRLLNYLFHHRGRAVSQSELSENLYAHDQERESNAIEALVARVRRKLKADVIETRRGFGYLVQAQQ